MFETRDAKRLEEEIVEGEPADKTFGFQLPEDEPGQVRMMVEMVMVVVVVMVMVIMVVMTFNCLGMSPAR